MVDWIVSLIEAVGYAGITLLMFLEIPIPLIQSEIVMPFSGFTASQGPLRWPLVVLAGVTGSQLGSVALYAVARRASEEQVNRFLSRYGGWLGFTPHNLERAQDLFRRHDRWAVLIGRLLPGLRSFIAIPAGVQRMRFGLFFLFNLVGTVFWVGVLTYLGTVLGDNYRRVDQYSGYISSALVAAVVGYVVVRLAMLVRRHVRT